MKRDMDLVRDVLFRVEEDKVGVQLLDSFPQSERAKLEYHIGIMIDGGLVLGEKVSYGGHPNVRSLTWVGHDFIELARNSDRWSQVKRAFGTGGGFTLSAVSQVLIQLAANAASKQLGIL